MYFRLFNNINSIAKSKLGYFELIKFSFIYIKKFGLINFLLKVNNIFRNSCSNDQKNLSYNRFAHEPLISVLIVAYKSAADLRTLLPSLTNQSYNKFEIIIVQNDDENLNFISNLTNKTVKIYNSGGNIGFAAANNIALDYAEGELICLVNPDTLLDEDCFLNLTYSLRHDPNVAVAVPKIRFWEKFIDLIVECDSDFYINLYSFRDSLKYKKWFLITGTQKEKYFESIGKLIRLRIPVVDADINFLVSSNSGVNLRIYPDRSRILGFKSFKFENKIINIKFNMRAQDHPSASWVINNAGSGFADGSPFDIGFGEYDYGAFDESKYVFAMCGCVAMIRRIILLDQKLFINEFFAYYEDSELSRRLASENWKIKYDPRALVRHRHSSSTDEGSLVWSTLVNRSRLIYDALNPDKFSNKKLQELLYYDYKTIPIELAEKLKSYDNSLIKIQNFDNLKIQSRKKIAVYNSYWNTCGGGEMHALSFALAVKQNMEVYLLSESDFDLSYLEKYFNLELIGFKKLIVPNIELEFTKKFDIFINSTYNSNLKSEAKKSYYIVSFPHNKISAEVLKSYKFLHNSNYTKEWAFKYWGVHNSELIYPVLQYRPNLNIEYSKENIIVSVGRFTNRGHAKRQDIIIKAFIELYILKKTNGYQLVLCGSLDLSSIDDVNYFDQLKIMAMDFPVNFYPNCPKDFLNEIYKKSRIYIHATGVDVDHLKFPEKMEHFGISVFESILYGCFPIVYKYGGPSEICQTMNIGYVYENYEELLLLLQNIVMSSINMNFETISKYSSNFINSNNYVINKLL